MLEKEKKVTIKKSDSNLTIAGTAINGHKVPGATFDLDKREGERIRVHIGLDWKYNVDILARQQELVCELDIPKRAYESEDTGTFDPEGKKIYRSVRKKVALDEIPLREYGVAIVKMEEVKRL